MYLMVLYDDDSSDLTMDKTTTAIHLRFMCLLVLVRLMVYPCIRQTERLSSEVHRYGKKYGIPMMMPSNGNIFHVTGSLCGEFTGHRQIPLT